MTLRHTLIFMTVFALVSGIALTSPQTRAELSAQQKRMMSETTMERAERVAWELFATACIANNKEQIDKWANKQIHLIPAKIADKQKFAGMWKNLGYPVPYKLQNMWGVVRTPVWLYEHENHGCTVTTYAMIPAETIRERLDLIAESFSRSTGKKATVVEKSNGDIFTQLLAMGVDEPGLKGYIIARTFYNKKDGTKTVLQYILTPATLSL